MSVAPTVPAPTVPAPLQKDGLLWQSTKQVGEEEEILACLLIILVNIDKVNSGQAQRQQVEGYIFHVIASADGQIILLEASMAQDLFIGNLWHKGQWMAPERKASIMVFLDDEGLEMLRLGAKEGWSKDVFIANGYGMVSLAPLSTTHWWTES